MKVSASMGIVMQLAGQEAKAAEFKEIEPEHLLAGLLKFSELPVEEVAKIAPGAEVARELAVEVSAVRQELKNRSIGSKRVRHELRSKLGKGNSPHHGGTMHRSQASRNMFDAANKLAEDARSETLTVSHLLEAILSSPTPLMEQVLGKALGHRVAKSVATPLLDECGQDLTSVAASGKLPCFSPRQAESKALLQALINRRGILLIGDHEDPARSVVLSAAQSIASEDCPPGIKGKRLVDISMINVPRGTDALDRFQKLFAEAGQSGNVILVVPPLKTVAALNTVGDEHVQWLDFLKAALTQQTVRFICRTQPSIYEQHLRKDSTWKRLAHVMWLSDNGVGEVPREL